MTIENTITINGTRYDVKVSIVKNDTNDRYAITVNGTKQIFECLDYSTALFFGMGVDVAFHALREQIY